MKWNYHFLLMHMSRWHILQYLDYTILNFTKNCAGPDIPSVHVFSLPDNKLLWTMDRNSHLHHQVIVMAIILNLIIGLQQADISSMPRSLKMKVSLPGTNRKAQVQLTLPPVLREEEDFKFPLVVNMLVKSYRCLW